MFALLLLIALSTLVATDPLMCPDGCSTSEQSSDEGAGSTPNDSECWICQLAVFGGLEILLPPVMISAPPPEPIFSIVLAYYVPHRQPPRRS